MAMVFDLVVSLGLHLLSVVHHLALLYLLFKLLVVSALLDLVVTHCIAPYESSSLLLFHGYAHNCQV